MKKANLGISIAILLLGLCVVNGNLLVVQIKPKSTTQDLLDACEQTWDAGFRMYPDVWEEPEYPYRIECISYPQNKHDKQVWFTHFYNPKTNKLK